MITTRTTMVSEKESEETTSSDGDQAWGTLEELLLACAVNRHGTTSWDSIAKELQKRIINHSSFLFSAYNCKRKYVDLTRRFSGGGADAGTVGGGGGAADDGEEREISGEDLRRMVDELRKLRVEELRREVQRHDRSIVSLQLKVKRLQEERDNTSPKKVEQPSDLRIEPDRNAIRTSEMSGEPDRYSPEKSASPEDRSVNESNSSSHDKPPPEKERESNSEPKPEPNPVRKPEPSRPGESRRESGKQQQSSDVQSSASLSRKKRRRISGDEVEAEEVSPAKKRSDVKSQPLIRFWEILRAHKHGSVFQRRLPSQRADKYQNAIREHMDLDIVQSKLDEGIYDDCHPKFYRDLLLIFTNAVLFYHKNSLEYLAARELRKLVTNETSQITTTTEKVQPDSETNHLEPVVKRPRSSTTSLVVCRRRNNYGSMQALSESINNKNGTTKLEVGRKDEKKIKVDGSNSKGREKGGDGEDEDDLKLVPRERTILRSGGLRLNSEKNRKMVSKEVVNKEEKVTSNKKGAGVLKKQGVVNFLKRMKQNSTSSQENGMNNGDDDTEDEEEEEGERQRRETARSSTSKKNGANSKRNNNNNNAKDVGVVVSRRNSTRRGAKEATTTTTRASGRQPKRNAAATVNGSTSESRKGGKSGGKNGDEKPKKKPRR